jgi:hypothetical protein
VSVLTPADLASGQAVPAPRSPRLSGFALAIAIAVPSWGCGAEISYTSQFAPGFVPRHHTISVLGVYKDGQMSSGAWDAIEPRLAPALGAARCPAGYTDTLASTHNALSAAIEDYARSDGPTDDLLTRLAPAATGDLILVVTIAGKLPLHETGEAPKASSSAYGGGAGGARGGMGGAPMHGPAPVTSTDELDLSASLFSVSRSQSVAVVALRYLGTSVDEAVSKLATKLAGSFPEAACAGWNWNAPIDADAIRHSIDSP